MLRTIAVQLRSLRCRNGHLAVGLTGGGQTTIGLRDNGGLLRLRDCIVVAVSAVTKWVKYKIASDADRPIT